MIDLEGFIVRLAFSRLVDQKRIGENPCFGIDHSGPAPEVTGTLENLLLRRRASYGRRSGLPKPCLIHEKPSPLFYNIPEMASV